MRQQSTAMRASATKNRYIDLANNTRDALLCNEPLYWGWSVDIMRYATLNIVNIWLYAVSENGFPKNIKKRGLSMVYHSFPHEHCHLGNSFSVGLTHMEIVPELTQKNWR